MGRMIGAAAVAVLLIFLVFFGQQYLHGIATDLADFADGMSELLSDEKGDEGVCSLATLEERFLQKKPWLLFFWNDTRIHEVQRALSRARRLAEEGDWSPALEALSDFSASLRELAATYRPTAENILKFMNLSDFRP